MVVARVFNFWVFFYDGFGGNRCGGPGKLCDLHKTALIPIAEARHSGSGIDWVRNTRYRSSTRLS